MFDPIEVIKELVSNPSVSTDPSYEAGMQGTRDVLKKLFTGMNLDVEVVDTDRHPVILAKRTGPEEWPHVVIYGHYDVQPPGAEELWSNPPFGAEIVDGVIYARGATDNKSGLLAFVRAAQAFLEVRGQPPVSLKFLFEGEEEVGSPHRERSDLQHSGSSEDRRGTTGRDDRSQLRPGHTIVGSVEGTVRI